MADQKEGYNKLKDKELAKVFGKVGEKYWNVTINSYDGKPPKIRIMPRSKNTNPNADKNKQYITQKGLTGLTKDDAKELAKLLEQIVDKFPA